MQEKLVVQQLADEHRRALNDIQREKADLEKQASQQLVALGELNGMKAKLETESLSLKAEKNMLEQQAKFRLEEERDRALKEKADLDAAKAEINMLTAER